VASGFEGTYYAGVPVTLEALPAEGWRFAGWQDGEGDAAREVRLAEDTELVARFIAE
jgi:hypothetical protein